MMKNIADMTQAEKEELIEIEMRGRFLTMACDLEWTMFLIMTHCTTDPQNQTRTFEGMMMHNKIECTIADLKRFRPALYQEYEGELLKLWEFKILRNDMSHHRIEFEKNLLSFRFLYVDVQDGKERLFEKRYMVQDIYNSITMFRQLNITLVELFMNVKNDGKVTPTTKN